jgi:hypothetical protein
VARAAAIKLVLDVFHRQWDARRATIHDDTDAGAMGFAPSADAEECTETAGHKGA